MEKSGTEAVFRTGIKILNKGSTQKWTGHLEAYIRVHERCSTNNLEILAMHSLWLSHLWHYHYYLYRDNVSLKIVTLRFSEKITSSSV